MGAQVVAENGDVFEPGCDMIEATTLTEPDPNWRFVDSHGHEHQYDAEERTPTLRWVIDGVAAYEDGEEYSYGHHECVLCGDAAIR